MAEGGLLDGWRLEASLMVRGRMAAWLEDGWRIFEDWRVICWRLEQVAEGGLLDGWRMGGGRL